jgi:hypothetical protein
MPYWEMPGKGDFPKPNAARRILRKHRRIIVHGYPGAGFARNPIFRVCPDVRRGNISHTKTRKHEKNSPQNKEKMQNHNRHKGGEVYAFSCENTHGMWCGLIREVPCVPWF